MKLYYDMSSKIFLQKYNSTRITVRKLLKVIENIFGIEGKMVD
jgi:hypothetical protein